MPAKAVTIVYRNKPLHFLAGRYIDRLPGTTGVRLAPEIREPFDIELPIEDFGVPSMKAYEEGLQRILIATLNGQLCYIGCMGGIGRTGLVLAGLFRVLSASKQDPVAWVRQNYLPHAVERPEQEALARNFNVEAVRRALELDPDGITTFEEGVAATFRWFAKLGRPRNRPYDVRD